MHMARTYALGNVNFAKLTYVESEIFIDKSSKVYSDVMCNQMDKIDRM